MWVRYSDEERSYSGEAAFHVSSTQKIYFLSKQACSTAAQEQIYVKKDKAGARISLIFHAVMTPARTWDGLVATAIEFIFSSNLADRSLMLWEFICRILIRSYFWFLCLAMLRFQTMRESEICSGLKCELPDPFCCMHRGGGCFFFGER